MLLAVSLFAGCPGATTGTPAPAPAAPAPAALDEDEERLAAARGRACDSDAECPYPLTCVDNCASGLGPRATTSLIADVDCPRVCADGAAEGEDDAEDEEDDEAEDEDDDEDEEDDDDDEEDGDRSGPAAVVVAGSSRLAPVETSARGDGKLLAAVRDVTALVEELTRAAGAASGCNGRVAAVERWAAANHARVQPAHYRVVHLSSKRNHDYDAAEKAALDRYETAYERFLGALLAVCDEDSPVLARLGEVDLDLEATYHRSSQTGVLGDKRCPALHELRDRALLAPESLIGKLLPSGLNFTTVMPDGYVCLVDGAAWTSGRSRELLIMCTDYGRSERQFMKDPILNEQTDIWEGRLEFLNGFLEQCLAWVGAAEYGYTTSGKTFKTVTLRGKTPPHAITGAPDPAQENRYAFRISRPR